MLLFDSVVLVRGLSPPSHEVQPTWPGDGLDRRVHQMLAGQ